MSNIYWTYDEENVEHFNAKKLLVIGQSGAGKTSLARYLQDNYSQYFEIIKNSTTRNAREDDGNDFCYYSHNEFETLQKDGAFFFARFGELPLYGYKKDDYTKIVNRGKVPIFMFRLSGFVCLKEKLKNFHAIFLISDLKDSLIHSRAKLTHDLENESLRIQQEILNTIKDLKLENTMKYSILKNDYSDNFFREIDHLLLEEQIWSNNE